MFYGMFYQGSIMFQTQMRCVCIRLWLSEIKQYSQPLDLSKLKKDFKLIPTLRSMENRTLFLDYSGPELYFVRSVVRFLIWSGIRSSFPKCWNMDGRTMDRRSLENPKQKKTDFNDLWCGQGFKFLIFSTDQRKDPRQICLDQDPYRTRSRIKNLDNSSKSGPVF